MAYKAEHRIIRTLNACLPTCEDSSRIFEVTRVPTESAKKYYSLIVQIIGRFLNNHSPSGFCHTHKKLRREYLSCIRNPVK